jgi:hypothetical protein
MSEKKRKNAQAAEAPQPSETPVAASTEQPKQETTPTPSSNEPAAPVGIQIPPKVMEKVKALGLEEYIAPFTTYIDGLEKRLAMHEKAMEIIAEQMPQKSAEIVVRELNKVAAERQKQALEQGQTSQALPSGGGGGFDIGTILKLIGGDQPAANPMQIKATELMNRLLDRAISNITEKSAFERYFEEEIAKAKAKAMAAQVVS